MEQGRACNRVSVLPAGCVSRSRHGRAAADIEAMAAAGAVAFTDDGAMIADGALLRRVMRLAGVIGLPVLDHALDPELAGNGVMHQGPRSEFYGVPGIPAEAEEAAVERDIAMAAETGCAVHIQHVSTKGATVLVRRARERGVPVSAEATPHHLALTDADVDIDNPDFKMNPPLRSEADREALLEAVAGGVIQALATDHAPHRARDKAKGFLTAPFGIVGLETAVGVTHAALVQSGRMNLADWVLRWTDGPARILGLPSPQLVEGGPADLAILDLDGEWEVDPGEFLSRSGNTPFAGRRLTGRAVATFRKGVMTWGGDIPA
jgi:dihydroorotase